MGRAPLQLVLTSQQEAALRAKARTFSEQGRHRWADRCNAILMKAEGETLDEVGRKLGRPRSTVQNWVTTWRDEGLRGMDPKTHERGAKKKLDDHERMLLAKAIERGPKKAGIASGVWTSPMIADYIQDRWGVEYHPGHVRKLLHEMGFSIQFPREKLSRASREEQEKWLRNSLPRIKKKPSGAARPSSSRTKSSSSKKARRGRAGRDAA